MSRRITFVGTLIILAAAASLTYVSNFRPAPAQTGGAAFTVVRLARYYNPQGIQVHSAVYLHAVRTDGSHVDLTSLYDNKPAGGRKIVDVGLRKSVTVDPQTESITTYPMGDGWIRFETRNLGSCTENPNAQRDHIQGYEVVKVTKDLGPTNIRDESWLAPSLSCYALGSKQWHVDPATGTTKNLFATIETLSVTLGEPAASLFEIPAHFTERSPSEVFAELARRKGESCRTCDTSGRMLDDVYTRAQSRK